METIKILVWENLKAITNIIFDIFEWSVKNEDFTNEFIFDNIEDSKECYRILTEDYNFTSIKFI